jgi:hypothetical protein
LAFNTWPLKAKWSMSELKDRISSEKESSLVRLIYTYKFESVFGDPYHEWLKAIENKCNEVLGNFNKKENEALTAAFGGWKKRRLNCAFDTIGFVYPEYPRMTQGGGRGNKGG